MPRVESTMMAAKRSIHRTTCECGRSDVMRYKCWRVCGATILLLIMRTNETLICNSINARNSAADLKQLEGCTVVEGFVKIVLMEHANETDFDDYSFPELREITEFLMVARVRGLRSLGKLFPNLERIGGYRFMDSTNYALVVHEMWSLEDIGLKSLKEITKGSVIIYKNRSLCFVKTINWSLIQNKSDVNKNYMSLNYDPAYCPPCPQCKDGLCWNGADCQINTRERADCHKLCVGGCFDSGPNGCYSCRGLLDPNGNCSDRCPSNTYEFLNRRCITREECITTPLHYDDNGSDEYSDNYIIFEDKCLVDCPSGYMPNRKETDCHPCKAGKCQKLCLGADIKSIEAAKALSGCTHVIGSVNISIKSNNPKATTTELEAHLGSIEEITGCLKVTRSSVTDFNFLRNLTLIRGNAKGGNALIVMENHHLQKLWDWNVKKNLSVLKGRLFFHYNPKLCLEHIDKLMKVIHYEHNVTNFEIERESNGYKFSCYEVAIENITVTSKSFDMLQIHVPYSEIYGTFGAIQFVVYYTKDPFMNLSMFDDLDQCSDHGWKTKDFLIYPNDDYFRNNGFFVDLIDLEPFTLYAFYVTSYNINRKGARSRVNHDKTLPSTPSELAQLQAFSNASNTITLQWLPPNCINGKLKEYVVTWFELVEESPLAALRNYCDHPIAYRTPTYPDLHVTTTPQTFAKSNDCCEVENKPTSTIDSFQNLCLREKEMFELIIYRPSDPNTPKSVNKFIFKNSKQHTGNINPKNKTTFESETKQNVIRLSPYSLGTTITGLKNFRDYVISVTACRSTDPDEPYTSETLKCSRREIVIVRTQEDRESDKINGGIQYEVAERSLSIFWNAPQNPNGLLVAFEIHYQTSNVNNPKPTVDCVTFSEYEKNGKRHTITGLSSGEYEFRIRAISLSGGGPFTHFIRFSIEDEILSTSEILLICVLLIIVTALTLFLISYCYRTKPYDNYNVVFAEVNPNYQYIADHFEVERENVEFGRELGVGSFGKVYEGILKPKKTHCAIKTLFENATEQNEQEFLREATVMKSMVDAHHIVKLLGVVSEGRPSLVIMELMELGDLKSYLRKLREIRPLSNATMIKMSIEIADAMAFMEAHKFVHRDLAARNCMVGRDLTIKVGDFGMARDIYETDYYRKMNKGFLPIRWMAPESLKDGEFTSQSDVWSYGVVLWEIVTMAEQPYQGCSNEQVLHEVISGKTLDIPNNCPLSLRSTVRSCWRTKPSSRPSFMHLLFSLEYYHDDDFKQTAYYYTREAEILRKAVWEYVRMENLVDTFQQV
uniref:Tyrosine-protein kinase receptor n=1 Tax=Cuerna arida TaxID=1464854 RepID=A0A1B6GW53_9HEMI